MRTDPTPALALAIDPAALKPLVEAVVEATVARLDQARDTVGDKLAVREPVAAGLLSMATHQLRDERLRGRIASSKLAGKIYYTRADLLDYLARHRTDAA